MWERASSLPHTQPSRNKLRGIAPIANKQIVETDEFETEDPALRGEMTITISLTDADGDTDIVAVHDGLPRGVSPADNETGWKMALTKLAGLVESGRTVH